MRTFVRLQSGEKREYPWGVADVLPDGGLRVVDQSGVEEDERIEVGGWTHVLISADQPGGENQ